MFSFGDVLVINFPFTDARGSKRRPVMVIKETDDGDILVAKVTSRNYNTQFDIQINNWQNAGLLSSSVVRVHKIQTIHSSLVFAHIGRLSSADVKLTRRGIVDLIMNS